MSDLAAVLRARIARDGPLRLDHWMAACNAAYYTGPDPLGRDFVTAPEISQMFGEIIGGWIGDLWLRAGRPAVRLVELGPGRGTLIADALRVLARVPGFAAPLALVETSPALRAQQAGRVVADWYDSLSDVPDDLPVIIIANEFFDALPIRQFDGAGGERAAAIAGDGFAAAVIPAPGTPAGEASPAGHVIAAVIGDRLRRQGGAALIIDYGYADTVAGDTLQALRNHSMADPFAAPGDSDLTAHVDFTALARAAGALRVSGPVPQGVWLARLGIEARAAALQSRNRDAAGGIAAALVRLTAPTQMGNLFKAMALSAPHWPKPAGFDT
ncbi:class I SAM-dependent methyltransferase [Sandarakinorhabdus sp. DWP1-3-1]|uniref:class I SAM-dependent methyltransferase n=1 Tax=Sandarakinorhabdus sp. DWP1-3-1 TaxID=2804627 RepID=UPI003CF5FDEA